MTHVNTLGTAVCVRFEYDPRVIGLEIDGPTAPIERALALNCGADLDPRRALVILHAGVTRVFVTVGAPRAMRDQSDDKDKLNAVPSSTPPSTS